MAIGRVLPARMEVTSMPIPVRVIAIVLALFTARAWPQAAFPDTPAGQTAQAWLNAFNSADRAKLASYVKAIDSTESVDNLLSFRSQTGGFDLVAIDSSEPLHLRFRVMERDSSTVSLVNLTVTAGNPPTVASFALRAIPPGVVPERVILNAALRKKVIEGINSELALYYVDPSIAADMENALVQHSHAGDYKSITDGDAFAARLTQDLRAVSHDKHLRVDFSPFKIPPRHEPSAEDERHFQQHMARTNCAFQKVSILPGNIGYIKFNGFMDPGFCGATVNAAMQFVAHTDALIFDIRDNGGGQPAMVTLVASYLFDRPTPLIDIYDRANGTTTQNWTLSYLPGQRLTTQPVYVLTSARTFSGAEEFAFDLKNQKRATIVGETTGGGAHPVSVQIVADYFTIGIPFAASFDPVTKTNWEGVGVVPDVKVDAADALDTAEKLALEKIDALRNPKQLAITDKHPM